MAPAVTLVSSAIGLTRSLRDRGIRAIRIAPSSGVAMSAGRIGKLGDAPDDAARTGVSRAVPVTGSSS